MANKIIGVVFLLGAVLCGVVFFAGAFMHGRMRVKSDDLMFGAGAIACLVAAGVAFFSKRKDGATG